jgi:uncharacterized protein (TIRG00374 family)
MRRSLFWLGIAISIAFLYFALRGLKLDEFVSDIQQANLIWLLPGIALYFIAVAVRTWRWSWLLRPMKQVPVLRLFPLVVIGYMGNNIYPARIGELLRSFLLRRIEGVPMSSSLATILIERILDGITMLAFVLIGLPRVPNLSQVVLNGILLASLAFVIATASFFWLALYPQMADRLAHAVITRVVPHRFQAPLLGITQKFVQGAQALRNPRDLSMIVLSTVVIWLLETGKYWCVAQAFNLGLPFDGLMLVNGLSNLFTIIPGAPGAVGTFDAGGILGTTALGVSNTTAAAYVLILHVVLWLPVTALGAYFMLREGLRWSDLKKAEEAVA